MLSHGDELGRSLHGNNNAYCHDSELNWLDWQLTPSELEFFEFTCEVLRISREYRTLRGPGQTGRGPLNDARPRDGLAWFDPDGRELTGDDVTTTDLSALAALVRPSAPRADSARAPEPSLLLLINGQNESRTFTLPAMLPPGTWQELVNTAHPQQRRSATDRLEVEPHSLVLLRHA